MVTLWALHREPWVRLVQTLLATLVSWSLASALGWWTLVVPAALVARRAPVGALLTSLLALAPLPLPAWACALTATTLFLVGLVLPHVFKDRIDFERVGNLGRRRVATSLALLPVAAPLLLETSLAMLGLRPSLQARLDVLDGRLLGRRQRLPWRNWGRTTSCVPSVSARPRDLAELRAAVLEAAARGLRVRAVGSGYSWSSLVATEDMLIHCERLKRVELDLSSPDEPRVWAEAGATNRQLNDALEAAGFTLPSNVVLEVPRVGGLIATGSHGSGFSQPTLSDYVHAVEMVMADGSLRRFERGVDPDDVINTVALSLGSCGVLYRVCLDVEPAHNVRMLDRMLPMDEVMANIDERVRSADALDLFWFPGTEKFWVKRVERTARAQTHSARHSVLDVLRAAVDAECYRLLAALVGVWPGLTPWLGRMTLHLGAPMGDRVVPRADAVHYRRHADLACLTNIEIAFKIDPRFDTVRRAVADFRRITRAWHERGEQPLTTAFNVRFIKRSDALLSPAAGPGHTCYIEVLSFKGTPGWEEYTRELGAAWLALPQAAPHWAKQWEHLPEVDAAIARRYGERLLRFRAVQRDLDPEGRFHNHLLNRVLACAERVELEAARAEESKVA